MPKLGKMHFSYSKKGIAAYKKAIALLEIELDYWLQYANNCDWANCPGEERAKHVRTAQRLLHPGNQFVLLDDVWILNDE